MGINLRQQTFKRVADHLEQAIAALEKADKELGESEYWSSTTERRDIFQGIIKYKRLREAFLS